MSKLNLYGTKQIYVQLDNSKSMESKIEKIFNCRNQWQRKFEQYT